ncbi:MAG: glycosyltransferase, partial [Candidatus Helarchaeota archaeon]
MKILLVNTTYLPKFSVPGLVVNHIANGLIERGHEVFVFCSNDKGENNLGQIKYYQVDQVKVASIGTGKIVVRKKDFLISPYLKLNCPIPEIKNYFNPDMNVFFRNYIKDVHPDIIHFHNVEKLGASLIDVAKSEGFPIVLHMHDWWWFCPKKFLVDNRIQVCSQSRVVNPRYCYCFKDRKFVIKRFFYLKSILKNADMIVSPSKYLKEWLIDNGISSQKVNVVFESISRNNKIYRKKTSDIIRFGYLGGKNPYKGLQVLSKAYKGINRGKAVLKLYGVGGFLFMNSIGNSLGNKIVTKNYRKISMKLSIKNIMNRL